ncbi:hypothetical protein D0T12_03820 [Actinomadura spongiicola]|uniref:Ig-like domain-containing protein n=2 Tax=Actinomadura spongiicola TaxID=2303421 RepID=A0A372GPN5_9ACTN|nr:hypothetical protein D0T12_03820 [Actinomadura spongiicola]
MAHGLLLPLLAGSIFLTVNPSAASAATADPKAGDPCKAADLGKRYPFVKSAVTEPTITHFKGYYITDGSTGSQSVTMSTQTVITVEVGNSSQISSGFSIGTLFKVEAFVSRTVRKATATTNAESQTITWNFLKPGYYGLYQGTNKVTGVYGSLNCGRVDLGGGRYTTRWIERPGGTYTTFSTIEEGAVRCEDKVPANSIMSKAQKVLGCTGTPAQAAPRPPAPKPPTNQTAAQPPGFTCLAGYYRIATPDRLLFWWNANGTDEFRLHSWANNARVQWQVCQGPTTNGMVEHVFLTRQSKKCLTLRASDAPTESAPFYEEKCRTVDDGQRFYVYDDVPGTNLVGIQNKMTGFMIGQERVTDNETMRQYSLGKPDGTGTYVLEPVP